jgi:RHS repeat-associated protein
LIPSSSQPEFSSDFFQEMRILLENETYRCGNPSYTRSHPFGNTSVIEGPEHYLFTGKERDSTGLYYYGARYYDPQVGRFLTRDPYTSLPDDSRAISSSEGIYMGYINPQDLNRYSYAENNPLKFNDPTGLCSVCAEIGYEVTQAKPFDLAALINLDTIGFQVNSIGANLNELGRMHIGFFSALASGGGGGISDEDCYFVTIRRCVDNLTGKVTVSTVGPPCYYYDDEDNKKEGQRSKEECRGQATSDKRFGLMLPHEDCTFDIIEDCGEFDIGEFAEGDGDGDGFCVGSFLLSIYVGLVVFIDFLKRQKKRTET